MGEVSGSDATAPASIADAIATAGFVQGTVAPTPAAVTTAAVIARALGARDIPYHLRIDPDATTRAAVIFDLDPLDAPPIALSSSDRIAVVAAATVDALVEGQLARSDRVLLAAAMLAEVPIGTTPSWDALTEVVGEPYPTAGGLSIPGAAPGDLSRSLRLWLPTSGDQRATEAWLADTADPTDAVLAAMLDDAYPPSAVEAAEASVEHTPLALGEFASVEAVAEIVVAAGRTDPAGLLAAATAGVLPIDAIDRWHAYGRDVHRSAQAARVVTTGIVAIPTSDPAVLAGAADLLRAYRVGTDHLVGVGETAVVACSVRPVAGDLLAPLLSGEDHPRQGGAHRQWVTPEEPPTPAAVADRIDLSGAA
jgi:hypothetical protein